MKTIVDVSLAGVAGDESVSNLLRFLPQGFRYRCEIVIREDKEDGGFLGLVPMLPSAYSQGNTIEETVERVEEAILGMILCYKDDGEDIPWEKDTFVYEEDDLKKWVFVDA